MKKADNFDAKQWLVENKITTQSRLNDFISPSYLLYSQSAGPKRGFDPHTQTFVLPPTRLSVRESTF